MTMPKRLVSIVAFVCMMGLLAGCSSTPVEEPAEVVEEVAEEAAVDYQVIGTGSTEVLVTNKTGADITGITIKNSASEEYPENMMAVGSKFAQEETVQLLYTPVPAEEQVTESTEATSDKAINELYDIRLSYEDGSVIEIQDVALSGMHDIELCYSDEVGYLTYVDAETGEQVSTKETALAQKAEAEAAATAAAEAEAAAAEEAATAASKQSSDSSSSSSSSSNSNSSDSSSSGSDSSDDSSDSVEQSEDSCLDGVAIN